MSQFVGRVGWWLPIIAMCIAAPLYGAPGEGIKLSSGVTITPKLEVTFGYDWNPLRLPDEQITDSSYQSGLFDISPSVGATFKRHEVLAQFSVDWLARDYFASSVASYADDFRFGGQVDVLPESFVGLVISDTLARRPKPVVTEDANSDPDVETRTYNQFSADGRYSPGSALDLNLGIGWLWDLQEYAAGESGGRENEFSLSARGKWRFFPRTSLLAEAEYVNGTWADLTNSSKAGSNDQWKAMFGIGGQFTQSIQANLYLGYGGLYHEGLSGTSANVSGLSGVLGQTQIIYRPQETQSLRVGFVRLYDDSANLHYWISDAIYLGYAGLFFDKLGLDARFRFDFRTLTYLDGESEDITVPSVVINADYGVTNWLSAIAHYQYVNYQDRYTRKVLSIGVRGVY